MGQSVYNGTADNADDIGKVNDMVIDKDGKDALYPTVKHTVLEDAYAFAIGCSFIALGIVMLHTAGLTTGGVAGIALLVSYVAPLPVGLLFILINIPFFLFAWPAMGKRFMIKTVIVNLAIELLNRALDPKLRAA